MAIYSPLYPFDSFWPKVDEQAFIAPGVTLLGDIEIAADTNIWPGTVIRGDVNHVRIGARVNIQDGTVVHTATNGPPTLIEDDVTIGHMALIHACHLGKGAFVGMKSMVMDGAVVEDGAMVAAGAMITPGKTVPSGWLWAGWPARPLRRLTDQDKKLIRWTVPHYIELAKRHQQSLNKDNILPQKGQSYDQ